MEEGISVEIKLDEFAVLFLQQFYFCELILRNVYEIKIH